MTAADLSTTNTWLAVIAIASLVQSLVIIGLVVAMFRMFRKAETSINELKRDVVEPMTARANKVIDEVEDALARFRSMDERVNGAIDRTTEGLSAVATVARRRFWPVVGVVRGLRAIAGAIGDKRRRSKALVNLDEDGQQRFSYEGGISHARTFNAR